MLEKANDNQLNFKPLSEEEKEKRGILGRLYGPCASTIKSTRNGRYYSNALWEKVFNNPINKEMIAKGGIPGELDHPADRLETDSSKIAIMMPESPKKDKDGRLIGYWDIIDTPCGKIAYALAKYGFKFGISSRGDGDTYIGEDGEEYVNEDTYNFQAFDLVLLPACEDARLELQESFKNNESFKKALYESYNNADSDSKKIMQETLEHLNIKLTKQDYDTNKMVNNKTTIVANNAGTNVVKELQESLLKQKQLRTQITQLQEKLSVCNAKESKYEEDISKYKNAIKNLSNNTEETTSLKEQIKNLTERLNRKDEIINRLRESKRNEKETINTKLNESLNEKDLKIREQEIKINRLNEKLNRLSNNNEELQQLNENLSNLKENFKIKENQLNKKIEEYQKQLAKSKTITKMAVNRYIESQAIKLGISSKKIYEKLPKDYSFNDIDRICEDYSDFKLRANDLPFVLNENTKIKVNKKEEPILKTGFDDSIDDSLLKLAGVD